MITQSRIIQQLVLGIFVAAAVGCGTNLAETRQGRAAGEWQFHLPTTRSPIGGLAYGRDGSSAPASPAVAEAQTEQPLLAAAPVAKPVQHSLRVRRVVTAPSAPAPSEVTPPDAQQPPAIAPNPEPAPVQLAQAEPTAEQRYGEREATTPKLEQFRGGDAIIISAGALLLVLLIVILILLLR